MDTQFIIELLQALVALVSLIMSNTAVVEAFKRIFNLIVKQFPIISTFTIKGTGTFIVAGIAAYLIGQWADVDLAGLLGLNKYLNPQLIWLATWAITLIGSGKAADLFAKKAVGADINLSATVTSPATSDTVDASGKSDVVTTTTNTFTQKTE